MNDTQIIILAAGKGTRMESDKPKALTFLSGKPFLGHIVNTVFNLDLKHKPIVVVGYKKEDIYEYLHYKKDEFKFVEQKEQLGTGHAVLQTKNSTDTHVKTIVVLYADHPLISKDTIEKLIKTQQDLDAKIVVAPTNLSDFEGWRKAFLKWGRFKRDGNGKLIGIVEYKDATEEEKNITEVNPGYFAFDKDWMEKHLENLKNDNAGMEYYLTDLLKIAFEEKMEIGSLSIPPEEALGANSKEELEILENLYKEKNKS